MFVFDQMPQLDIARAVGRTNVTHTAYSKLCGVRAKVFQLATVYEIHLIKFDLDQLLSLIFFIRSIHFQYSTPSNAFQNIVSVPPVRANFFYSIYSC